MKSNNQLINEQINQLNELIRSASKLLNPYGNDDLSWLQKKDIRDRLFGKHPKCFLQLSNKYGEPIPYFCVCNRLGIQDPKIIDFSKKLVSKLMDDKKYNKTELEIISMKLDKLFNTYSKSIPKPTSNAIRKGYQTRKFKIIKNYIDQVRK